MRQHIPEALSSPIEFIEFVSEGGLVLEQAEAGETKIPDVDMVVGGFPCQDYTFEEANLLAAVVMHNPEIDCDVLFQYCDLREIYDPIEVFNVALQYDAIPYRKWSSPLDFGEIGMGDLSLHEKCALQLGWELAGKDDSRDRADMSVEELIHFGETEAEERDLEVWLHGYMDPYEGEIDTARYSMAEIVSKLLSN